MSPSLTCKHDCLLRNPSFAGVNCVSGGGGVLLCLCQCKGLRFVGYVAVVFVRTMLFVYMAYKGSRYVFCAYGMHFCYATVPPRLPFTSRAQPHITQHTPSWQHLSHTASSTPAPSRLLSSVTQTSCEIASHAWFSYLGLSSTGLAVDACQTMLAVWVNIIAS